MPFEVSTDKVDNMHGVFCKHMGIRPETWGSVFEFSAFMGFWCINCFDPQVRRGGIQLITTNAQRLIEQLEGLHAHALIAAYKHRHNSPLGRMRHFFIKSSHVIGFVLLVPVGLFMEITGLQK